MKGNKNIIILYILVTISIILSLILLFKKNGAGESYTAINDDKKSKLEFVVKDGYLQYKENDNDWHNLIELSELNVSQNENTNIVNGKDGKDGKDGRDGKDGKDGKTPEFSIKNNYLVWRYKGDKKWIKLLDLNTLNINSEKEEPEEDLTVLVDNPIFKTKLDCILNSSTCETGEKVSLWVNEDELWDFYVLNDDGDKLTLIANDNVVIESAFGSSKAEGPKKLMESLADSTSLWTNIEYIENYSYNNYGVNKDGYKDISIESGKVQITNASGEVYQQDALTRARTITYEEVKKYDSSCTTGANSCKQQFIYDFENALGRYTGYYTLSTYNGNDNNAYYIKMDTTTAKIATKSVTTISKVGIRPVIEVPKKVTKAKARTLKYKFDNPILSAVNESNNCLNYNNQCSTGNEINVRVNSDSTYVFNVLSDDGKVLTLQSREKMGDSVIWNSTTGTNLSIANAGPITLLDSLYHITNDWDNIEYYPDYEHQNYGYYHYTDKHAGYRYLKYVDGMVSIVGNDGVTITNYKNKLKARLLTYNEAFNFGCRQSDSHCESFIIHNSNKSGSLEGMWLFDSYATSLDEPESKNAYFIYLSDSFNGIISNKVMNTGIIQQSISNKMYVKPVIAVKKQLIQSEYDKLEL